jgi:hypothetical protein
MTKLILILIFIFTVSYEVNARNGKTGIENESPVTETRPFFKNKDLDKPKNIIVGDDFDINYSLVVYNEDCKIPLEIKNISKEEKRNTFSLEAYSYANKKYEAFVTEKRSKPGEVISTQVIFANIDCHDIKRINFYR